MTADTGSPSPAPHSRADFPPLRRLRCAADYERIYAIRQKAGDGLLLIFAGLRVEVAQTRAGAELPPTRIGLSVSKKHGGAVVRNRLKRLLRDAFRLVRHELPAGLDLIAIPLDASRATRNGYMHSLKQLVGRLARRIRT